MIAEFLAAYAALSAPERTEADRRADFRAVFGTDQGQRVLLDLMKIARVIEPVQADDPIALQRSDGMRGLLYVILRYLTAEALPDNKTLNHRI